MLQVWEHGEQCLPTQRTLLTKSQTQSMWLYIQGVIEWDSTLILYLYRKQLQWIYLECPLWAPTPRVYGQKI